MRVLTVVRSPRWGLPGQGLRFALAGGCVALLYLTTTVLLSEGLGAPFQLALAVGFTAGLVLHFTLQRVFVWGHGEFELGIRAQMVRYLSVASLQYLTTASVTSVAPRRLGMSVTLVYVVTVAIVTLLNFVVLRTRIFHPKC